MRIIDADEFFENLTGYAAPEMVWDAGDIEHKLDETPTVDPVHAVGGCYCWECIYNNEGHCVKMGGISIIEIGFCGSGERRESDATD